VSFDILKPLYSDDMPNVRPKLVVNDSMLRSPTVKQVSTTVRPVLRSRKARRSRAFLNFLRV
jgi:hypothetical protein